MARPWHQRRAHGVPAPERRFAGAIPIVRKARRRPSRPPPSMGRCDMRILVVKSEKSIGAVLTRVTPANAGPEVTARAEAALRTVNPGVDFNRLKPGDVLVMPDMSDVGPRQGDTISGAVLAPVVEHARANLTQLKNRLTAA